MNHSALSKGEGRYLGVPSYFIRTTGCNLRCEWQNQDGSTTKCDTPYTSFNPEKGEDLDSFKVIDQLKYENLNHIVITGGEPALQKDLEEIVTTFLSHNYNVTVETNGTIYVPNMNDAFISISPKLQSSYAQTDKRESNIHAANNSFYDSCQRWMETNPFQFKFVYNERNDEEEINRVQRNLRIPNESIYVMPQGITSNQFKEKEKELFQVCLENGWNYTPRLHIDIFGNRRGI